MYILSAIVYLISSESKIVSGFLIVKTYSGGNLQASRTPRWPVNTAIGAAVIYQQKLEILIGTSQNRFNGLRDMRLSILERKDITEISVLHDSS